MDIKMKQVLLFALIVILTIGIVNAANMTDTDSKDMITKISEEHNTTHLVTKDKINTAKSVIKKANTTTKKAASNTYTTTANNYKELLTKINHATNTTYDTYTINLKKGTYNATNTINWDNTKGCKKLVINGNHAILNGQNKMRLMAIGENKTVSLYNLKITNFKSAESGGAISNNGTLKIINSTLNNNKALYGGAIYNGYGNITIINSTLNNNKVGNGGAIYNNDGNITIINSTLNNNKAESDGGVICTHYRGNIIITNSTLNNNKAEWDGGAISDWNGRLTVYNSSFVNNTAGEYGGAIYSYSGTETVYNSSFVNNTAGEDGGAILGDTLTVYDTSFVNNTAERHGGAIADYFEKTIVNNSQFVNNTARYRGGAIISGCGNLTVNKSSFKNNMADDGGAISCYSGTETVYNSQFVNNTAKEGGSICSADDKVTIYNSSFKNYSALGKSIYFERSDFYSKNNNFSRKFSEEIKFNELNKGNIVINNNYFNKEKISQYYHLKIYMYPSKYFETDFGDDIQIYGSVDDEENFINEVIITVNNETFTTKTDNKDKFSLVYKTKKPGKNVITVTYKKIGKYDSNKVTTEFNVIKPTNIILYKVPIATKGKVSKISGKLLSNNKGIKGANVTININGKKYKAKTYSSGYFTVNYLVPTFNQRTVKVSYAGNNAYSKTNNTTTFNVKQKTKINILTKGTVASGKTVKISGQLRLTNNKGVKAQKVTIIIGFKNYTVKTFRSGYFTVNHVFDASKSKVTVKFIFDGSKSYLASNVTSVLKIS